MTIEVLAERVRPLTKLSLKLKTDDLVELENPNEPSIIHHIKKRFISLSYCVCVCVFMSV